MMPNPPDNPDCRDIQAKAPTAGTGMDGDRGAEASLAGTTYIIAIGIDEYDCPGLTDFKYKNCSKDCKDLVETLLTGYKSFELYKDILLDQQATKAVILNRLSEFIKDTRDHNSINNNLVLYFSGHGTEVKQGFEEVGTGCWVPYGCKDPTDYDELVRNDELILKLKGLKTQNLLFISDSCQSGKIFDEISPFAGSAHVTKIEGKEISRWAIVSSRSNELSKAGGPGENSKFTCGLLKILEENTDKELQVSSIIANLDKYFATDNDQKSYAGRLVFPTLTNTGNFILQADQDMQDIRKRRELLQQGLWLLNYTDQEKCFSEFKAKAKKQFAFFSGTPKCGLNHLIHRARDYEGFPAQSQAPLPISPTLTSGTGDQRILDIFSLAFGPTFSDLGSLAEHILSRLRIQSLLFEFRFYRDLETRDQETNEAEIRPKDKKALLDLLAGFLNTIQDAYPEDNRLFLFVIDQECCNYQVLYASNPLPGIYPVFLPVVTPLDQKGAEEWYTLFRKSIIGGKTGRDEFDKLFKEVLLSKLPVMVEETMGYPGSLVRRICKEAKCPNLVEDLMY
jgi:hypothetical protein